MRRVGSVDQRENSRGGSTPAQVSKICSTSAPALSCPSRYWIEFSTSTSMIWANASGWRYAIIRAGAWSGVPWPATM